MSKVFGQARRAALQPRHAALYSVTYGEREDAATQVRPRHPTPHLMGCAPLYCNLLALRGF